MGASDGGGVCDPVGGRRHSVRPAEGGGEGADATQADEEANVRDRAVRVTEEGRGALQPASEQVLVRRLAEGPVELAAEVRRREMGGAGERRDVERLAVARVDEVLRAKEVPDRMSCCRAQSTATIASISSGSRRLSIRPTSRTLVAAKCGEWMKSERIDARGYRASTMSRQDERAKQFRALHAGEAFVIPNPWDAGSARVLEALGFEALATTSSGLAFTLGRIDGGATLDDVAAHVAALCQATDLPLSVDLENGYGPDPEHAARAIVRVAEAGAVGGSIEDYDPEAGIYGETHAAERVAGAVDAARGLGFPFMVTARAENHIRGNPDLEDTISRLQAFEDAGADVLYAPGLRTAAEIQAVCEAVSRPVNVLALPDLSVSEIVEAGAQRISVGGGLTWVAVSAMAAAAAELRDTGGLSSLAARVPLDKWLAER